jgi:hypothetical protein
LDDLFAQVVGVVGLDVGFVPPGDAGQAAIAASGGTAPELQTGELALKIG